MTGHHYNYNELYSNLQRAHRHRHHQDQHHHQHHNDSKLSSNLQRASVHDRPTVGGADEAGSLFGFPERDSDQRCFDHDDIDAGGDVCHAFHDEIDDRGGDTDLSLLLMMYFSAAVNSPASFGSIVTRSSICTLFSLDAFVFALACNFVLIIFEALHETFFLLTISGV